MMSILKIVIAFHVKKHYVHFKCLDRRKTLQSLIVREVRIL